jgi:hypothetical protein
MRAIVFIDTPLFGKIGVSRASHAEPPISPFGVHPGVVSRGPAFGANFTPRDNTGPDVIKRKITFFTPFAQPENFSFS